MSRRGLLTGASFAAATTAAGFVSGVRLRRSAKPATERWRNLTVEPPGTTLIGVSFRPLQAEAFGLEVEATLSTLLQLPFDVIRIPAYWNRIEAGGRRHSWQELDAQIEAAVIAGKQIILGVGAVKNFGYPEVFVPPHHLDPPLVEGTTIDPVTHAWLCRAACDFVAQVVDRYRGRAAIVAWQVEHEAVDPLGMEHSWRLATDFVRTEVSAVRAADATRPVVMNGFLPTSLPVRLQQWWRTRDQGDSLDVAQHCADIVGVDHYPRHALLSMGPMSIYLDGTNGLWDRSRRHHLYASVGGEAQNLMVAEAQAEPWEAVTTPPSPYGKVMSSCDPADIIENYNRWMTWSAHEDVALHAYLLWGAEYWILRQRSGDPSYLCAVERILDTRS